MFDRLSNRQQNNDEFYLPDKKKTVSFYSNVVIMS